jgi:hypothetical protein
MGSQMIQDDGGARLGVAKAWDHDLLQKRLKHRPLGGGGHGHDVY